MCRKMIEILDSIDINLSHIKPTFAVYTYILFAQIKLSKNQVEVVELVNKCIRQIDASIDLYFYKNDKAERVKIWSNHNLFQEVKEAYDKKDFNKVFEFSIYKKQNGYWQIDDI